MADFRVDLICDSPTWVWLKIKKRELRKLLSLVSVAKVPFWVRVFEAQPLGVARLEAKRNPFRVALFGKPSGRPRAFGAQKWLVDNPQYSSLLAPIGLGGAYLGALDNHAILGCVPRRPCQSPPKTAPMRYLRKPQVVIHIKGV